MTAKRPVSKYVKPDVTYMVKENPDPWEGFNRRIYKFNAKFDQYVFLPVVKGYEFITPSFVQTGVSNFFNNVGELENLANSLLQLKFNKAAVTTGRILVNSTLGIGGLIESAQVMGLERQDEDFGQTLGHYGVGTGPYIVLPIYGPSNLRDAAGLAVDSVGFYLIDPFNFDENKELSYVYSGMNAIDKRHQTSFRYYETGSPFEYELVRLFYTEARKIMIDN
jgi:phospholipid-binding lipoprotein MlaA